MDNDLYQQTPGTGRIRGRLIGMIERLFAAEDDRARDRGWQVRPIHGGFGRSYRDPRWDRVRRCECAEIEIDPGCPDCAGTGVIRGPDTPPPDTTDTTGTEAA